MVTVKLSVGMIAKIKIYNFDNLEDAKVKAKKVLKNKYGIEPTQDVIVLEENDCFIEFLIIDEEYRRLEYI